ncbi:hypothetical protein NDN13_07150 [Acinetobacter sp. C32I]|uniref:hypothetical protein n=1 Tax=Acinetobacter sp. C32I TaxID=2950074 RepID=UPI0020368E4D|nr:hypothetical protein [Acinetobacter sp. C32I]USA54952.1 hypothetical protein NDN13_07150 [Acinetobacter sp. C32I]
MSNTVKNGNLHQLLNEIDERTKICISKYLSIYTNFSNSLSISPVKKEVLSKEGYDEVKKIIVDKHILIRESINTLIPVLREFTINIPAYNSQLKSYIEQLISIEVSLVNLQNKIVIFSESLSETALGNDSLKNSITTKINELTQSLNKKNSEILNILDDLIYNLNLINNEITIKSNQRNGERKIQHTTK